MPATGPDFISLQARDLDASQAFYEQYLGLVRSQAGPPHAVVFDTKPIAFALRDVVPGTDLASVPQPGVGAAIWLHATDVQAIHDALVADGHAVVAAPIAVAPAPWMTSAMRGPPATTTRNTPCSRPRTSSLAAV